MRRWCTTCGARFTSEVAFCPNDGTPLQEMPEDEQPGVDPLIGRVIDGRYRVEEQIGEGGMGMVYLVSHTVLGKRMALKVLRGEMAKDADVVQRFIQEAQAATSIGHENIIDITDFGKLPDGAVYFVMELLEGEALTDLVGRGGSIPTQEALQIIRQIASALGAAHARGIVHRDLKPDNVHLVRKRSNARFVKVLDFGIAKVGGASTKLTKTGMVFGTPHYMSPEQAAGQSVDHRTDIYALGVIMYEMFTGKVPFDADTFMGILSKHMFEPPVPPSQAGAGNRLGALEDVILKALAKQPEHRHQSMDELVGELDTVRAGGTLVLGARDGVPPPDNLADSLEPPSRTEMRLSHGEARPRRRTTLLAAAGVLGVLVLAVAVGGAVLAFGDDGDEPNPPVVVAPVPPVQTAPDSGISAGDPQDGEVRTVEIRSDPIGAQVLVQGAIVGNTPVAIPVPEAGQTREVELRQQGYVREVVRLMHDSPPSISVPLTAGPQERESAADRRRDRRRPTRPQAEGQSGTTVDAPETGMTTTMRRPVTSEVVDPWATP